MNKVLWLDVDGVLLDWSRPFLDYVKSPLSYDQLTEYDLSSLFAGGTEQMVRAINDFNSSPYYGNLEPLISQWELQKLKDIGYTLNIITQVDGKIPRQLRINNISKCFGDKLFGGIIFTERGESKARILRANEPYETVMVVEDNPNFFLEAACVGGFDARAISHPYNYKELKALRGFPIYSDMREVARDLCSRE